MALFSRGGSILRGCRRVAKPQAPDSLSDPAAPRQSCPFDLKRIPLSVINYLRQFFQQVVSPDR
jgi:hypothetical protein